MAADTLDMDAIRAQFPALSKPFVYGDNAGGSQILQSSIDRMVDYMINTNVQMGSDYAIASTERCLSLAQEHAATLFNAASADEIVFGASSTQNLENLARGLEGDVQQGDEVVVMCEHEANGGPWKSMAKRRGAEVKVWWPEPVEKENQYSFSYSGYEEFFKKTVTSKTRLVAFTACSNILGAVLPVKEIVRCIRALGKKAGSSKIEICLDCVAYAPHKKMDVQDWDVDFAVMSFYKVYGPHISSMYVRKGALTSSVSSIVHHFLSPGYDGIGYKLQPAGPGYESTWGTTAVVPYLESLTSDGTVDAAYEAVSAHDVELAGKLLDFLEAEKQFKRGVRVVGEKASPNRMPTVSFVVKSGDNGEEEIKSKDLIRRVDAKGKVGVQMTGCGQWF